MHSRHTFLVIDADAHHAAYLADLLEYYGLRADKTASIPTALAHLSRFDYIGVILDGDQFGDDWLTLLEWLRLHERAEAVIVAGGAIRPAALEASEPARIIKRLQKPVRPTDLHNALGACASHEATPHEARLHDGTPRSLTGKAAALLMGACHE